MLTPSTVFFCNPWLPSWSKLVDQFPVHCVKTDAFILVQIPADKQLGETDDDFSNVRVSSFTPEGEMIKENVETFIVPNGKLGSLKGGLLFLDDFRAPLAKEEVSGLAIEYAQSILSRRRRGFLVGIAVLPWKLYCIRMPVSNDFGGAGTWH